MRRKVSRMSLLARLRTTAHPIFLVTVMPNRVAEVTKFGANRNTKCSVNTRAPSA